MKAWPKKHTIYEAFLYFPKYVKGDVYDYRALGIWAPNKRWRRSRSLNDYTWGISHVR